MEEMKTIRQSDLLNRIVIDRDTMEEMGRVEVLWMYPPIHRVLGFVCKAGFLGKTKFAYRLAQLEELKDDRILVHSQPDATDAERVRLLESLLQYEVWSDTGERLGKITDCLFKRKNGKIIHYLFTSNGLSGVLGDVYQLPPTKILSVDEHRVMVEDAIVPTLHLDREGLVQKLSDVKEFVRVEAAFEWRSFTRRANRLTSGTKERFQDLTQQTQDLTQQTQEKTQQFTQEAKAKIKVLDEQLQEFPMTWVDRLRSKSQTVAEQVKQRTQDLSQQMEAGIGVILEQTEDWFGEEREGVRSEGVSSEEISHGEPDSQKTDSQKTDSQKTDSQKTDSQKTDSQKTVGQTLLTEDSQQTIVQHNSKLDQDISEESELNEKKSNETTADTVAAEDEWDDLWDDVWNDLTPNSTSIPAPEQLSSDRPQTPSSSTPDPSIYQKPTPIYCTQSTDDDRIDEEFENDEFENDEFENEEFENEEFDKDDEPWI
jgi:uncharacterized protein YrrD